jgi:hypothetical protein
MTPCRTPNPRPDVDTNDRREYFFPGELWKEVATLQKTVKELVAKYPRFGAWPIENTSTPCPVA